MSNLIYRKAQVFLRRLQRFFITTVIGGVVVVLPITLLLLGIRFIYQLIISLLTPISSLFNFSPDAERWIVDLLALSVAVGVFFLIGLLIRTGFGKQFVNYIETNFLMQLPLYTVFRDTVQQFAGQKKMPFSQVVLVDVYKSGVLMTGFVTEEMDNDMCTIFVPTAPNPTNGFIFHVPRDQVTYVDVKPEVAMRTVIGVGTGSAILFNGSHLQNKE